MCYIETLISCNQDRALCLPTIGRKLGVQSVCTNPIILTSNVEGIRGCAAQMGPNFPAEILRHGSHFALKSLDMGPDFQNLRKILSNQPFLRQKTLRNGSQFSKFSKKRSNQPFFVRKKSLDMGRGFGGRAARRTPLSRYNSSTPRGKGRRREEKRM